MQVLARTIGRGQYGRKRKIKLSPDGILLCERCSRLPETWADATCNDTSEVLLAVRRTRTTIPSAPLFERVEA